VLYLSIISRCIHYSFRSLPYGWPIVSSSSPSLFQFPDWCDLLLPHSIFTIISFPYGHPVGAYVFHFVFPSFICFPIYFPSLMCFRRQLLRRMLPIHLPCFLFTVCRLFLSSLIHTIVPAYFLHHSPSPHFKIFPCGFFGFFHWHNTSSRTMALGSTQPLTEMSTRNVSWG